jgi:acyl carrier protein
MEREQIREQIKDVMVSVLRHDNFMITDELTAADVDGWDSLSNMRIITAIEEKFKVAFKLKEVNKLKNIGIMIDLIQSKL